MITFMDISERRQKEAEILYLITMNPDRLHNRRYFEESRIKMEKNFIFNNPENLSSVSPYLSDVKRTERFTNCHIRTCCGG